MTSNQTPFRCHDADACALGQKPCPTPEACGSAPDYIALAHASGAATYIPSHGARGLTFTFAQLGDFVARVQAAQAQDVQRDAMPMVASLWVEESGVIDFEVIPPCTLPPGEYILYAKSNAAAQAAQGGA